jgi:hypothetical protein
MLSEIVGMMTGLLITCVIVTAVIVLVVMEHRSRRIRQKMLHEERMLALEKGLPVPMDYADMRSKRRPYMKGLVMMAIGCGTMVLSISNGRDEALSGSFLGIGSIFILVGIALFIGDWLAAKQSKGQSGYPSGGSQNQL